LLLLLLLLLLLGDLSKTAQGSVVSNLISMKFGGIVLHLNMHRLSESDFRFDVHLQDGGHYVIWYNKVLPPGEWKRSVCRCLWSSVPQFLIYNILH